MFANGINPILLFNKYFNQAKKKENSDPTAFALATTSKTLMPSVRMVLLKDFDARGFVFYTNLLSQKSRELNKGSHASMCFYWNSLGIQVRILGSVMHVNAQEADNYFATRDRMTQLGSWSSRQSHPLKDISDLRGKIKFYSKKFPENVPRPPYWSGFRIVPKEIEFWKRGRFRLHQRVSFKKKKGGRWAQVKLYP
jgi:pyridoxamine 5'-phosphate oxidase